MTVRLSLLGSSTVEYDGQSLALPCERRNQLLVYLALKRTWVSRAELAALFWPEQQNKLAYTNLRKILFRLNALPWAREIELQSSALRFEVETGVLAFEAALREQRLVDALSLRRGELLAGFDDDSSEAWSSWLTFVSGVQEPRFIEVLKALTTPVQLARINRALAPILAQSNR